MDTFPRSSHNLPNPGTPSNAPPHAFPIRRDQSLARRALSRAASRPLQVTSRAGARGRIVRACEPDSRDRAAHAFLREMDSFLRVLESSLRTLELSQRTRQYWSDRIGIFPPRVGIVLPHAGAIPPHASSDPTHALRHPARAEICPARAARIPARPIFT